MVSYPLVGLIPLLFSRLKFFFLLFFSIVFAIYILISRQTQIDITNSSMNKFEHTQIDITKSHIECLSQIKLASHIYISNVSQHKFTKSSCIRIAKKNRHIANTHHRIARGQPPPPAACLLRRTSARHRRRGSALLQPPAANLL